jgi:hypothetical protein
VISAQLGSVGADDGVTMIGPACPVLNAGGADDAWATLQISMAPIPPSDGGSHAPGSADAGEPCAIGAKGRPTYVAVIQYGPFENAVLVPATFAGLPLLGYGIVATGPAPAVTLHIDNAACSVLLDGGVAPP